MLLGKYLKGLKVFFPPRTRVYVSISAVLIEIQNPNQFFALSICIKGILTYNTDQTQSDPGPQDHEAISALIKSKLQSVIK